MTDFVGFFTTGFDILKESNYGVILAITRVTWGELPSNLGFLFSVGYFGSYILLVLLLTLCDRRKLPHHTFYEHLFRTLNPRDVTNPKRKILDMHNLA